MMIENDIDSMDWDNTSVLGPANKNEQSRIPTLKESFENCSVLQIHNASWNFWGIPDIP